MPFRGCFGSKVLLKSALSLLFLSGGEEPLDEPDDGADEVLEGGELVAARVQHQVRQRAHRVETHLKSGRGAGLIAHKTLIKILGKFLGH